MNFESKHAKTARVFQRKFYWSEAENCYVFDRRSIYFEPIFDFYQTGNRIQRSEYLSLDSFLDELDFFMVRNIYNIFIIYL